MKMKKQILKNQSCPGSQKTLKFKSNRLKITTSFHRNIEKDAA